MVEGLQKRFAIQKQKNWDGMILCNWLATFEKRGPVELNYKIGTNYDVNTKLGNETRSTRLQKSCVSKYVHI